VESMNLLHNSSDLVIAPSEKIQKQLKSWKTKAPITVLPTGVDKITSKKGEIPHLRKSYNIRPSDKVVLFVGRVSKEKNLGLLISAFDLIAHELPTTKLLIVGPGDYDGSFRDQVDASPYAKRIIFTGRIDHDQLASVHGTVQYAGPHGVWLGGSVRYDSGLVSNPSDPVEVAADRDFYDLLPYVNLTADVPRVRPRTIADLAVGWDGRQADRRTWSAQVQVTNLTNRTALYNFQSVFVGTRLVQPRTMSARVTRHF